MDAMDDNRLAISTPLERPPPPAAPAGAPSRKRLSWPLIVSLIPTSLGLLTGMFYLNGQAYFLGYLAYFHLEPSMFGDDLTQQVFRSVAAWLYASTDLFSWLGGQFHWTLLALLLLPIGGVVVLCVGAAVLRVVGGFALRAGRWLGGAIAPAMTHPQLRRCARWLGRVFAPPAMVRPFLRGLGTTYIVGYFGYLALSGLILVLILLVAPFDAVGRSIAARDVANGFASSPRVSVTAADGTLATYHVILCAPRYCALFDGKVAITVSAATVARAESPVPGKSQALSTHRTRLDALRNDLASWRAQGRPSAVTG
jgi:hypothetical protein